MQFAKLNCVSGLRLTAKHPGHRFETSLNGPANR